MYDLELRNRKIIDAVVEKANRDCPGSLALIGIYGSFRTGDFYEKSDLDLLILINDDRGWQLGCAFIQDDPEVGHDIYCTGWDSLREDALYNSPNIAKLMDSKIVYCSDEKYLKELEKLRAKARGILAAPFSREDYIKSEKMMREAEHFYSLAMLAEDMSEVWVQAGGAVYYIENAVAMLNKRYFRLGTKRFYEESGSMDKKPLGFCEMIEKVLAASSGEEVKSSLTLLMRETLRTFKKAGEAVSAQKKPVTAESIRGTYEEMFSNWRNKMYAAAEENNRHLAFMSMLGMNAMLSETESELDIGGYDVFACYDPNDLGKTARAFDELLNEYLKEYRRAGLEPERYGDIDEFIKHYLGRE